MSEMQDYNSRLSDPASRKFETFSYLPAMTQDEIRNQVDYIVKQRLEPGHRAHRAGEHLRPLLVHVEAADVRRDQR